MSFRDKILGIINSSKTGPEMLGMICANPSIVNFDVTVNDLKEIRDIVDEETFNRIIVSLQNALEHRDRPDVGELLKEKLND